MRGRNVKESIERLELNEELNEDINSERDKSLFCFGIILLLGFAILIVWIICLQGDVNSIPKWECHTEVVTEKLTDYWTHLEETNCYPLAAEIICEEGLRAEEYQSMDKKCIWSEGDYDSTTKATCLIKTTEEICKIVYE